MALSHRSFQALRSKDAGQDESSENSSIDMKVAGIYGFHPLIHISDGNIWLDTHMMILFLISTGFVIYRFFKVNIFLHTGKGRLCTVGKKRNNIYLKLTDHILQIRYGQFDQSNFPKKPFSIEEGYKYIARTFIVFQTLLASRTTEYRILVISLITKMKENIRGYTYFEENEVVIFSKLWENVQFGTITLIHELSHMFVGISNDEDHDFSFYSIHAALNVIFLQCMKNYIPIDFELFKLCKSSAESIHTKHKPISNTNGPIIIID